MNPKRILDFLFGVPLLWFLAPFFRSNPKGAAPFKKILLIKLAAVGDTLLLEPVLRTFKETYPEIEIDWLVSPINLSIAKMIPGISRFWVLSKQTPFSLLQLVFRLKKEKYDAVIDAEQWSRGTALIAAFSGAPCRAGFDTPGQYRSKLYTHAYPKSFNQHELSDFFDLFSLLLPLNKSTAFHFEVDADSERELFSVVGETLLKAGSRPKVLIHPGCGDDGFPREWPIPNYAVVAHWLIKKFNAEIFITAGPEETVKSKALYQLLGGKAHDLGGRLSWKGTMALVKSMDLVLSGNTGVMHLAAVFGKNQVALHGPTNPTLWGPLNPNARVVSTSCPDCPSLKLGFEYHSRNQSCMRRIDAEHVKRVIQEIFQSKNLIKA